MSWCRSAVDLETPLLEWTEWILQTLHNEIRTKTDWMQVSRNDSNMQLLPDCRISYRTGMLLEPLHHRCLKVAKGDRWKTVTVASSTSRPSDVVCKVTQSDSHAMLFTQRMPSHSLQRASTRGTIRARLKNCRFDYIWEDPILLAYKGRIFAWCGFDYSKPSYRLRISIGATSNNLLIMAS